MTTNFQLSPSLDRVRTVLHPCVWTLASVFLIMAPDRTPRHVVVRVAVFPMLRRPLRTPHPCWRGCHHSSGTRYSPGQSRYLITSPTLKLPHSTSRVQPDMHDQNDQVGVPSFWCACSLTPPDAVRFIRRITAADLMSISRHPVLLILSALPPDSVILLLLGQDILRYKYYVKGH